MQRHGNETDLFEQDIAAMCEAQPEEEDEQAEVVEVAEQDYDEMCNTHTDRRYLTRLRRDNNAVQTVLCM